MKLKMIAAAAAFAATGIASAAVNPGTDFADGGEMILSVWDDATSTSYTLDLGPVDSRNFDGAGLYTYDLAADVNWVTFTAGVEDVNALKWDVVASDRDVVNVQDPTPSINGVWTTARQGEDAAVASASYSAFNTLQSAVEQYANILDGLDEDYVANESYLLSGSSYAGDTATWGSWKGNQTFAIASYGEEVDFWQLTTVKGAHPRPGMYTPTAAHEKMIGTWTLANGELKYSAVPLPAAAWLFMSSLIGLVGIARRRKA